VTAPTNKSIAMHARVSKRPIKETQTIKNAWLLKGTLG